MTRTYHRNTTRAASFVAAAAFALTTAHAHAQMLGQNIFGGTNTAGTSIAATNATISAGQSNTGLVGPGFNTTVTLGVGALDTLTATINAGGNGTFTANESGQGVTVAGLPIGAGVGGTFTATKTIGAVFAPNQAYSFTLTAVNASNLALLSGANVTLSTVDNGVTTTIYTVPGGSGLLGLANVLNLFNGSNTATFNFTAPANVDTAVPITVTVSGGLTASALGSTFTFTGATLNAVPEPSTYGAMAVGLAGLAVLRFRHRLARS